MAVAGWRPRAMPGAAARCCEYSSRANADIVRTPRHRAARWGPWSFQGAGPWKRTFRSSSPSSSPEDRGPGLWPASRQSHPKQLLVLTGAQTMLQQTALRLQGFAHARLAQRPLLVTNEDYRFIVADQLAQVGISGLPHRAGAGRAGTPRRR